VIPIELDALTAGVFSGAEWFQHRWWWGRAKPTCHPGIAAGITGFIRPCSACATANIPKQLNFEKLTPHASDEVRIPAYPTSAAQATNARVVRCPPRPECRHSRSVAPTAHIIIETGTGTPAGDVGAGSR